MSLGKCAGDGADRCSLEKKSKVDALISFMAGEATEDKSLKAQELELRRLKLEERRIEVTKKDVSGKQTATSDCT